jgi:hypothetical protein
VPRLMQQNRSFRRAAACLAHPFSLLALVMLLLNDHLFRVYWPRWWTGKLGDLAWLFFFPFALATVLAWLIPGRMPNHEQWVPGLAFSLTGGIFTLAKTWLPFHRIIDKLASWLFGWPVNWRLDPTDLIALISLAGAAWLWRASIHWDLKECKPSWLLISLAACLTIANSAGPSEGVYCLELQDGQIYAITSWGTYVSRSGGLSWDPWEVSEQGWILCESHFYDDVVVSTTSLADPVELTDPANPQVVYRITTGKSIESSNDSGQTWITEFQPKLPSQPVQAYLSKNNPGVTRFKNPPLDAVFDPASGNLIFAMGFDGVLVRQTDGSYSQVGVGDYQPAGPRISQLLLTLFPGEILMALILGGLGVLILALPTNFSLFSRIVAGGAGFLWVIVALLIPPAIEGFGYAEVFVMLALGASGLALFPLVANVFVAAGFSSRILLTRYLQVFLVSGLFFFIPFIPWVLNLIPSYRLAQVFGIIISCGWIYEQFRREKQSERIPWGKAGLDSGWLTALSVTLALGAGFFLVWLPKLKWPGYIFLGLSLIPVLFPVIRSKGHRK